MCDESVLGMEQLAAEISEIRKEISDFKDKVSSDNEHKTKFLEELSAELKIQNDLLVTISSKLDIR